ncbi:LysR family transcriptional regulator [Methylibium sp. Pch-M]|jgi:DNA-binding transcriptional LysR family regulator|uniref:Transcriptional regulator, LysR family n=1 Tax=Methylibium petroleiphilum (strain ATCC BAA-1232 / LMG 22953 / PM1) TaxID=420662 RepID=A2SFV0_METPP|nr:MULTISPECIES: LysR family transcriptional regulator [Methylibium]ABM94439.1 transcriptional regulator, LysR family [Methylibium petroleiphilum PM1]EWS53147.1 HTH-type transcriptional activator CmpR [Methylibium sp. T29]EWS57693.1 HTH-type transcriptional activator CmpR [Methylibium sp. T29-B]MBN9203055.1 LysR family transcriptional regulator [Methylibium petroleiphilum]QAZ38082.1 LysR family transcriptional regulator [Methylibium sp. Pch-M]
MKNVTFRQLRVFTEVARHLSFARAAEALHLTPPAVTMQVKELESQVGLPLFERSGRGVSLSTAGEYYLVYAKRLLATLKDADDAMARFQRLETGLLTIGMVSTAKYFVPRLLARFREEHPGIDVRLQVSQNREQLLDLLHANECDLAVMGRPPKELATRAEPFAAHPLVFIAPPDHPLLRFGHPPLEALAPYPFIVREPGSGTRNAMERFFKEHRFAPRISMEMSSNETIKQAVMAGMGLSFLSLHTVGLELRSGLLHLVDVEGAPVMRSWNVVHLLSKLLSPSAEAFRYFILEEAEAYLVAHDTPLLSAGADR